MVGDGLPGYSPGLGGEVGALPGGALGRSCLLELTYHPGEKRLSGQPFD